MDRSQLRAARALLGWSQERLAEASGVSVPTIKRLEPGEGTVQTRVDTLEKLRRALQNAGVEFRPDGFVGIARTFTAHEMRERVSQGLSSRDP